MVYWGRVRSDAALWSLRGRPDPRTGHSNQEGTMTERPPRVDSDRMLRRGSPAHGRCRGSRRVGIGGGHGRDRHGSRESHRESATDREHPRRPRGVDDQALATKSPPSTTTPSTRLRSTAAPSTADHPPGHPQRRPRPPHRRLSRRPRITSRPHHRPPPRPSSGAAAGLSAGAAREQQPTTSQVRRIVTAVRPARRPQRKPP
jgi:hypothetical protein